MEWTIRILFVVVLIAFIVSILCSCSIVPLVNATVKSTIIRHDTAIIRGSARISPKDYRVVYK